MKKFAALFLAILLSGSVTMVMGHSQNIIVRDKSQCEKTDKSGTTYHTCPIPKDKLPKDKLPKDKFPKDKSFPKR